MLKTLALALAVTLSFAATACTSQDDDELVFDDDTGKADVVRPVGVYQRELGPDEAGFTLLQLNEDRTYKASQELVRCDPGACTDEFEGTYRFASSHGKRYIVLYNDGNWWESFEYKLSGDTLELRYSGLDGWFTMTRAAAAEDLALDEDDDGGTFEVGEGGDVVLTLAENATTGYQWVVTETDRTFGYPTEDVAAPDGPVGGGGTLTLTWHTTGGVESYVGEHHVKLEYRRPWDDASTAPGDTYEFTVDVTD